MKAASKNGWHTKPLEEIATFSNGLWKGKRGPFRKAKVLRNTNFRIHGAISYDDVAEIDVECKQFDKRQLRNGDIILERSGGGPKQPVGRVVLFELEDDDYSFSNFTSVIRVLDQSQVNPQFLHQVLNYWYSAGWTEKIQSRSTGIRNLDFKAYKRFPIPLPPLEEQQQIIAILDEIFEGLNRARSHAESNLQDAREMFNNFVVSTVSDNSQYWPNVTLPEIAQNLDKVRVPITKKDRTPGDVPYYGASGVADYVAEFLFDEDLLLISEDGANLLARTYPIAFSISGKSWVNNHAHVLRFEESIIQEYVRLYLNSISLEPYISGMAQPKLSQAALNQIPIPFPSESHRTEIVRRADSISGKSEQLVETYLAALNDLGDLRQSLLQRAFAGELT